MKPHPFFQNILLSEHLDGPLPEYPEVNLRPYP